MMIALLLKDFFILKKQLVSLLFITAFFAFMGIFTDFGMFFVLFIMFIGSSLVISVLGYEEMSNWGQFGNTLPISRNTIIASKYVFGILLSIGCLIIITPIVWISNYYEPVFSMPTLYVVLCLVLTVTFVFLSVLLPIFIKFGPNKGRLLMFAIYFIPTFLVTTLNEKVDFQSFLSMNWDTIKILGYTSPLFGFVLLSISYLLSTQIYKRKEF